MTSRSECWPQGWQHKYEDSHSAGKPWGFKTVKDFRPGVQGSTQRFELRAGDVSEPDKRGDLWFERSEMAQVEPLQSRGEEWWYGWSFMVPSEFPDAREVQKTAGQIHLSQFHQKPDPSAEVPKWNPPWMFGKRAGGPFCVRRFPNSDREKALWWTLIEDKDFRGNWHDVIVHARWSGIGDGFLEVWVDGVQKMGYFGPTCADHDGPIYFKYGLYRPSDAANSPAIAHFSGLRRGHSRSEVEFEAESKS